MYRISSYVASAAFAVVALAAGSRAYAEDPDQGLQKELSAMAAQVASLQATVSALQKQVGDLQTSNATLQTQLADAKNVLALDPFVSVNSNEAGGTGPVITFHGANVRFFAGSATSSD